jgi:hypothetical protein
MNWHMWVGAGLALAGSALIVSTLGEIRKAAATRRWLSTDGTVIESNVETEFNDGTYYHLKLTYRYEVDGKSYVSGRLRAQPSGVWSWAWPAQHTARRYKVGCSVRVYYSAVEPHESVLERGISWSRLAALGSIVAILFGNAWNQINQ